MNVKNEIYYHIHRIDQWQGEWKANSVIYWGQKELNNFNKFYNNHGFTTNLTNGMGYLYGRKALRNFLKQPESFQIQNYREIIQQALIIIKEQCIFTRETIFEEVRGNYFPSLPSRKTCLWVCTKDSLPYWWSALNGTKKIFKLELTGIMHKADEKYLICDTLSHDEIRANAFNYWTGSDGLNPKKEELLFEGVIKVLQEYYNLSDFYTI
ncbi:DUF2441 domain-containing protein [Clostridium lundense]|uniref:DUF2441 domain-containing protein n=1 Tax=Clostridium lundense TaxID=319475 RepID=UPI00048261D5|nr:DUF2441 domain-containing protein [Clostridium lundense]